MFSLTELQNKWRKGVKIDDCIKLTLHKHAFIVDVYYYVIKFTKFEN